MHLWVFDCSGSVVQRGWLQWLGMVGCSGLACIYQGLGAMVAGWVNVYCGLSPCPGLCVSVRLWFCMCAFDTDGGSSGEIPSELWWRDVWPLPLLWMFSQEPFRLKHIPS